MLRPDGKTCKSNSPRFSSPDQMLTAVFVISVGCFFLNLQRWILALMGIMAASRTLRAQKIRVCVDAEPDSPSALTEEPVRVSLTSLLTKEDVSSIRWEGEDKGFLLKDISEKKCMLLEYFCLLQCSRVTSV